MGNTMIWTMYTPDLHQKLMFKRDIKISYLNCNSNCITGNWAGLSKSQYWSFKWYLQWFGQFWLYDNANTLTMAIFALGWTNHLDRQMVWHLSIWCEFMLYCRRLVRLDDQIVFEKSSFQTAKYQMICS